MLKVLAGISDAPFTHEVREIGLQVAALMTADMIRRRVAVPVLTPPAGGSPRSRRSGARPSSPPTRSPTSSGSRGPTPRSAGIRWRTVASDNSCLGESVKPTEPFNMQVFIGRNGVKGIAKKLWGGGGA